jgi:hypothetical protein
LHHGFEERKSEGEIIMETRRIVKCISCRDGMHQPIGSIRFPANEPLCDICTADRVLIEDDITELLMNNLSHGSGIDNEWMIDYKYTKGKLTRIICSNGFHYMNDVGYYKGWVHFKFTICPGSRKLGFEGSLGNFYLNLTFNKSSSRYWIKRLQLRDLLEQWLLDDMENINEELNKIVKGK